MAFAALLQSARALEHAAGGTRLRQVPSQPLDLFDSVVTHRLLSAASRQLFADGHYTRAVEQGFKAVNRVVKERSGYADEGRPLMERAFSPKQPKLAVNELKTRTDIDQQTGTMMLFAGAMAGVRNVRTHDLDHHDDAQSAFELLAFANHLMRIAESATVTVRS